MFNYIQFNITIKKITEYKELYLGFQKLMKENKLAFSYMIMDKLYTFSLKKSLKR